MIIYGYKNRNVVLASGQFICPKCKMDRNYQHIRIVRYFTLFFFIQLFPLGNVGDYLECDTCHSIFKPEEIYGTPGNDQMVAEMKARKAESDRQTKANGGRNLAVIGGILMVISFCMLATLTAFQLTYDPEGGPTSDIVGTLLLAAVCPVPLGLAGLGLFFWGLNRRRSALEAVAAPMV